MTPLDAMPVVLTDGATIAWVDVADHAFALGFNWYACRSNRTNDAIYAKTKTSAKDGRTAVTMSLHRLIADRMGIPGGDGAEVDHRDGDSLNDSRSNLRPANHSQNMANRSLQSNNTTGVRGVYWAKHRNKWYAEIRVRKVRRHLGAFDSIEAAALAYDQAASEAFGDFARLNGSRWTTEPASAGDAPTPSAGERDRG